MEAEKLISWFEQESRELPWRVTPSPYAVWVSEVMLQQTQVAVVIPYFERWMEAFPTVEALAGAPIEQVIKLWEGLGYYSRARNLHAGAQSIVRDYQGKFPDTAEDLSKIKGIGPYTVGAILSFAYHKKAAAVDGNVMRVLARYYLIENDLRSSQTQRELRQLAEKILPDKKPWVFAEALIELGATVCARKAKCLDCPVQDGCGAYRDGRSHELPIKSKGVVITPLYREVPILLADDHILLRQVADGEIMSQLHEFPYFETEAGGWETHALAEKLQGDFQQEVKARTRLKEVTHGFTRYRARLRPTLFDCRKSSPPPQFQWVHRQQLPELPFSAGHRRILNDLLENHLR